MTRVVITDIKYKMALSPLISLARAGYKPVCCEYEDTPEKLCLGFYSKYAGERARVPKDDSALAAALDALAGPDGVILPVGRKTLRALAGRREHIKNAALLVSSAEVLEMADDKAYVYRAAKKLGIRAPETTFLSEYPSLEAMADAVRYPCIIKYRDGESLGLSSHERYSIARDRASFMREYARMNAVSPDPLAQEYLLGRDLGVAVVMDARSRPVDFICYESRREYPLSGGPTCLCETTFAPELLRCACALLTELGFSGIAMLDFKVGPEGPCILEINPRVWGSAALCRVAGAAFFESYVRAALGQAEPLALEACSPRYRLGAKMRFFPQSALAAAQAARRDGISSLGGTLKTALDLSVRDGLFMWSDARPYLRYLFNSGSKTE